MALSRGKKRVLEIDEDLRREKKAKMERVTQAAMQYRQFTRVEEELETKLAPTINEALSFALTNMNVGLCRHFLFAIAEEMREDAVFDLLEDSLRSILYRLVPPLESQAHFERFFPGMLDRYVAATNRVREARASHLNHLFILADFARRQGIPVRYNHSARKDGTVDVLGVVRGTGSGSFSVLTTSDDGKLATFVHSYRPRVASPRRVITDLLRAKGLTPTDCFEWTPDRSEESLCLSGWICATNLCMKNLTFMPMMGLGAAYIFSKVCALWGLQPVEMVVEQYLGDEQDRTFAEIFECLSG